MAIYNREEEYIKILTERTHTVKELSAKLFVSEPTIRRDILLLKKKELITCINGNVSLSRRFYEGANGPRQILCLKGKKPFKETLRFNERLTILAKTDTKTGTNRFDFRKIDRIIIHFCKNMQDFVCFLYKILYIWCAI